MTTITQHHHYEVPPRTIFKALTDAPTLCTWWTTDAESDAVIGGEFRLEWRHTPEALKEGRHDMVQEGRYIECDVNTIQYPWDVEGEATNVRFVLNVQAGGTDLKLEHSGLPDNQDALHALGDGWTFFLENLASVVSGGPDGRAGVGLQVGAAPSAR